MKKIKKTFSILLIIVLTFTGCFKINSKTNFLNQNFFYNEFEDVYETLVKSTYSKDNLILVAPKNGDHQLAINTFTDQSNQTFAIVFYKNEKFNQDKTEAYLRMAILQKKDNNKWILKLTIPCNGTDVDEIILTKNKNNPNYFLIVGLQINIANEMLTTDTKIMSVYDFDVENFRNINFKITTSHPYYEHENIITYKTMKICNLNKDENKLIILKPRHNNLVSFNLSKNFVIEENNKPVILDHADSYNIKIDSKNFTNPILFIDETVNNSLNKDLTHTEIFKYHSDGSFEQIFKSEKEFFRPPCLDIDNDGKIEIPETQAFANQQTKNNSPTLEKNSNIINFVPLITNWRKLTNSDGKLSSKIIKTYTNVHHGFGFILPNSWSSENIYATYLNKQKSIEFYEYEKNNKNLKNKKLLTISATCSKTPPTPEFFLLKSNGPFFFWAKIYNSNLIKNNQLLISKQQLKNSFFVLKGQT